MAAGLGFKDFTTGEVLTAADVDGYLMQGIWVFASEAARNAAVTSPQEGNFAFTKDTNSLWYYTGSAWAASGATGDIEGVTAGTGISGGGTSGTVTITNDMATTITAAGDIVVGTGSGTYDNLPIGTTGQILTADTTVSPYKVKWAAAAGATFVGCSLYKSAVQSIANDSSTTITWDLENYDTDSLHSTVTNTSRITIPSGKDGKWLFTGCMAFASNGTKVRRANLTVNGTTSYAPIAQQATVATDGDSTHGTFAWPLNLVAGDYVEMSAYQNSGGSLDFKTASVFTATYLGA